MFWKVPGSGLLFNKFTMVMIMNVFPHVPGNAPGGQRITSWELVLFLHLSRDLAVKLSRLPQTMSFPSELLSLESGVLDSAILVCMIAGHTQLLKCLLDTVCYHQISISLGKSVS